MLDVMPCPVMAMSCYANGEMSDEQVSLRGTVIIIANHGERIDIPAGEIHFFGGGLTRLTTCVSQELCWRTRLYLAT